MEGGSIVLARTTGMKSIKRNQPQDICHDIDTAGVDGCVLGQRSHNKQKTDWSKNAGDDTSVVNINRRGEKLKIIVNIYNLSARETGERPARRLNWENIIWPGEMTQCSWETSTAHSQYWDLRCTEWGITAYCEDIMNEHRLVIGNSEQPTHKCTRNESDGLSTVDPTMAN